MVVGRLTNVMKPKITNVTGVANLRNALIEDLKRSDELISEELLRKVIIEAEGLAVLTPYPLLLLPVLAEEKVERMKKWAIRQRQVQMESPLDRAA